LNQLLIPNDGFKDASYKNWLHLELFYETKFTALAKLAKCRIQYKSFKMFSLQSTETTQSYFEFYRK